MPPIGIKWGGGREKERDGEHRERVNGTKPQATPGSGQGEKDLQEGRAKGLPLRLHRGRSMRTLRRGEKGAPLTSASPRRSRRRPRRPRGSGPGCPGSDRAPLQAAVYRSQKRRCEKKKGQVGLGGERAGEEEERRTIDKEAESAAPAGRSRSSDY